MNMIGMLTSGNIIAPPAMRNGEEQPTRKNYREAPMWARAVALWVRVAMFVILAAGVPAIVRQFWQPPWSFGHSALGVILVFLLFDLSVYAFHRAQHRFLWLWKPHFIHHSDPVVDWSTTLYHHPTDIVAGALLIWGDTIFFNIPVAASAAFAVIFFLTAVWAHGGKRRPWHRYLSWILVTPMTHRRHHARDREVSNANYGLVTSLWDHAFGTFRETPPDLIVGVQHF